MIKNSTNQIMKGGEKEMEQSKETITRIVFKEKCPKCDKEVKGTSESQVKYNLDIHLRTQHNSSKKS